MAISPDWLFSDSVLGNFGLNRDSLVGARPRDASSEKWWILRGRLPRRQCVILTQMREFHATFVSGRAKNQRFRPKTGLVPVMLIVNKHETGRQS